MPTYRTKRCKLDPEYHERVKKWARENRKARYNNDPEFKERIRQSTLEQRQRIRAKLEELRAQLECSQCGEKDPDCLDFHHRDSSGKLRNVTACQSYKSLQTEMTKCDVLCANCHRKLHAQERRKQLAQNNE